MLINEVCLMVYCKALHKSPRSVQVALNPGLYLGPASIKLCRSH